MSTNEIETNNRKGSWLAEQGPSSGRCSWQGNIMGNIIKILSLVREESGLAKRIRMLWSAIYWVNPRLEGIENVCWIYGFKRVCFGYQKIWFQWPFYLERQRYHIRWKKEENESSFVYQQSETRCKKVRIQWKAWLTQWGSSQKTFGFSFSNDGIWII